MIIADFKGFALRGVILRPTSSPPPTTLPPPPPSVFQRSFDGLRFPLPDAEWVELVSLYLRAALDDNAPFKAQTSLLCVFSGLLEIKRDRELLELSWRPFFTLLQRVHYSTTQRPRARESESEEGHHRGALVDAVMAARRYFPTSAIHEIVTLLGPSLTSMHSQSPFLGTALLLLFLPRPTAISDLPPGTAVGWLNVWASVEHCTPWDGLWAQIFLLLAEARSLVDFDADAVFPSDAQNGDALAWGMRLPFFFARLTNALNLPVPGGEPIATTLPAGVGKLLGRHMPDAESNLSALVVQLLTIRVPNVVSEAFGDAPTTTTSKNGSPTSTTTTQTRGTSTTGAPLPPGIDNPRPGTADASAFGHIERLLRIASPLFHPAQPLFHVLLRLVSNLSTGIATRAGRESGALAARALLARANVPAPPPRRYPVSLDTALLTRAVDVFLPLATIGLYAAKGAPEIANEACRTLIALTPLAPARVTREIIAAARLALAFDCAPGAAHLAPHILNSLALLTPNLLFPIPHIAFFLPELLEASLPGIDPNDATKTAAAAAFFNVIAVSMAIVDDTDAEKGPSIVTDSNGAPRLPHWHPASATYSGIPIGTYVPNAVAMAGVLIPKGATACKLDGVSGPSRASGIADILPDGRLISTSSSDPDGIQENNGDNMSDIADTERALADSTVMEHFIAARTASPSLSEWALQVIDRSLKVFEARDKPERRMTRRARVHAKKEAALSQCVGSIFWAMSPAVRRRAVSRIASWVTASPPLECGKDIAHILSIVSRVEVLAGVPLTFGPLLIEATIAQGATDSARTWAFSLLNGALRSVGSGIVPLVPSLTIAFAKAFEPGVETKVRKSAGKALKAALKSLLLQYSVDERTHSSAAWAAPGTLWADWSPSYSWSPITAAPEFSPPAFIPSWHISTPIERSAALELLNTFLTPTIGRLSGGLEPTFLRSDLTVVMACAKGISAVTSITHEGDDSILGIASGSTSMTTLVWNTLLKRIEWASESESILPLRAVLSEILSSTALRLHTASASGTGASIDTAAAKQLIKNAYAVLVMRSARVTKSIEFITSVRFDRGKTALRTSAAFSATRIFIRAAHMLDPGPHPRSYTGRSMLGASSCGPRSLMAFRTHGVLLRRLCEAVNSVPRAAHGVRGVYTLGAADADILPGALADAAVDAEFTGAFCDAAAIVGVTAARDAFFTTSIIFGTITSTALSNVERPYAELIASICRLGETEFDEIREKSSSHILSSLSVWTKLRRPAALAALARLSAVSRGAGVVSRGVVSSLLSTATSSWAGWHHDSALSLRKTRLIRRSPAIVKRLPIEYHDATTAAAAALASRLLDDWVAPPESDKANAISAASIGLEALAAINPLAATIFGEELVASGMLLVGALTIALAEGSADVETSTAPPLKHCVLMVPVLLLLPHCHHQIFIGVCSFLVHQQLQWLFQLHYLLHYHS